MIWVALVFMFLSGLCLGFTIGRRLEEEHLMSIQKHYWTVTLLGVQVEVYWDSLFMPCVIEPQSQFIGLALGHWNLDIDWA